MQHRNIFRKILFCTDFNTDARDAFLYAVNITAGNPESELIILHAVPEPDAQFWKTYIYEVDDIDSKARQDMEKKMADEYTKAIPEGVQWRTLCVPGNVGEQILKTAAAESVDLIIMGRGGGSNIINRMLGDFTEKVVRKADCPVLIVPGQRAHRQAGTGRQV